MKITRNVERKNGYMHIDQVDELGRCIRQDVVKDSQVMAERKLLRASLFNYKDDSFKLLRIIHLGADSKPTSVTHYAGGELPVQIDELGADGEPIRQTFLEYDGQRLIRRTIKDILRDTTEVIEEPIPEDPLKKTREGQYGLRLEETDPVKDGIQIAKEIAKKNHAIACNVEASRQNKLDEAAYNQSLQEYPSNPER